MSRIFDIVFEKLALLLTPTFLRTSIMEGWISSLIYPLNDVYNRFLQARAEDLYKIEITPQVCSLERMLNDKFDVAQRRIRIGEIESKEPFYIFTEDEKTPAFIFAESEKKEHPNLYEEGVSIGAKKYDFTVLLPLDVWNFNKTEADFGEYRFYAIEAQLNFYKLGGKRYKIILN